MKHIIYFIGLTFLLISSTVLGAVYTTTSSGDFNNTSIWDDGLGGHPTSVVAGIDDFVVDIGHSVVVNDSINVNNLTVKGDLVFGDNTTARTVLVNGTLDVQSGGGISVSANNASHKLYVYGNFTTDGTVNLKNNTVQVVNLYLNGTISITGSTTPNFNNFSVISGTITTSEVLDVNGNFLISSGAIFNAGTYTHTVAGNFTENGTLNESTGTFDFDGTLVQSISVPVTFYNVNVSGGGILSLSDDFVVSGDLYVSNNSQIVTSDYSHQFNGAVTFDSGTKFTANNGRVYFNGSSDQTIILNGDVTFYQLYVQNSNKTITGSLVCNSTLYLYDGATLTDGVAGQTHYLSSVTFNGTADINFTGIVDFVTNGGRRIYKSGGGTIDFGTAELIIDGYMWIGNGVGNPTTLNVSNNVTVNDKYLVIDNGSALVDVTASKTFKVVANKTLYVRGASNFPSGFATYNLEDYSWVRYDADMDQTVQGGITYGYLYLYRHDKTSNGDITIDNNLYLYATGSDSVKFNLGTYDYHLKGSLVDNPDANYPSRRSKISATGGTFYFDAKDVNQTVYCRTATDTAYKFYNLTISNGTPTIVKTFTFNGNDPANLSDHVTDVIVLNNFTVSNGSTNESLYLQVDFNNTIVSNNSDGSTSSAGSGIFTLGDNVKMLVSGTDNFKKTTDAFGTKSLDANSTVRFDSPNTQSIPAITYGNLEFNGSGQKSAFFGGITVQGNITRVGGNCIFATKSFFSPVTHIIEGNWNLRTADVSYETPTGKQITVELAGANQQITYSTMFPNLIFRGSGTKDIEGNIDVNGDLDISNSITVDASNININVSGDWNNSSSGKFVNTNGQVSFDGDNNQTITIQSGNNSEFETVYINKLDTLLIASDVTIGQHLYFTQDRGDLNIGANTLYVGGNWYIQTGCELIWSAGALIHFNGSSEDQLIRNYNTNTIYPNLKFSGSGMKRLYETDFNIDGDFTIDNASVRAEWFDLYVSGNWENTGGSFAHYRAVHFDGANQTIDATEFEDVVVAGTGTKYLKGNINIGGYIRIDSLATLDVSPDGGTNSYNITVEESWYNNIFNTDSSSTGKFVPRTGTVTFIGEWSNIYTGDTLSENGSDRTGKSFYNLTIKNVSNDYWTRLYPDHSDASNSTKRANDLKVEHNFTLTAGIFYTYWNNIHVGGDFVNSGGYYNMNDYYDIPSTLYLEGTGSQILNPGSQHYFRGIEINKGGTYTLSDDLTMSADNDETDLIITNGKLDLNHNTLTINSNTGDVTIGSSGELDIDSLATLNMRDGRTITNNGVFSIVGTETGPATLSTISGNFYFKQEAGTIAAKYYSIDNTRDSGIVFYGGAIDATNNFSNGKFSGGIGNAYLTFPDGKMSIGSAMTIDEVIFNNGPSYNVTRDNNTGVATVTFQNSSGALSGEGNEDDDPSLIDWTYPGSKFWDGGGGDDSWHTAANWVGDVLPSSTDNVILDHTNVVAAYTVNITSDINVKSLSVGVSSGNTTDLVLNGANLDVDGNITIYTQGTLAQTQSTDTIFDAGGWSNAGTFNENSSVVVFNPASGTHSITTGGTSDSFNDLVIAGIDGEVVLGTNIDVAGDVSVDSGTFSASNKSIYVNGNWFVGAGTFNGGNGTVYFDRNDATAQTISGGYFNNVDIKNSSEKQLLDLIYLDGTMTIESGAKLNAGDNNVYVGDHWYNKQGKTGFVQTGTGTVVFNGSGTSFVGDYYHPENTDTTEFNNVMFEGSGTKYIANSIVVDGNMTNKTGSNVYVGASNLLSTKITGSSSGTFTMSGGTLYLLGENSFPESFGTYTITGGVVDYYSDTTQNIYGGADVNYYNLRIRRVHPYLSASYNGGANTIKTALGDLHVKNQIWANDTCTILNMNSHDLYTNGYLRLATQNVGYPPQVQWGTGSFIQEGGSTTLDPDVTEYNNIIKKGESWITLGVDITVTGNVTINDESYLNMQHYKMECNQSGKVFTLGANSRLYSYLEDTVTGDTVYAFPTGFASYSIDNTSYYYLRGTEDQAILPGVTYGTIYLYDNVAKTVRLYGNLDVNNNFYISYDGITLDDQGHNLNLAGTNNDLRGYTPTSTITFDSPDRQQVYAGGVFSDLYLNNVIVNGGGGVLDLNEVTVHIAGDLTITAGDTLYSNDDIKFEGDSLVNNGYMQHTYDAFTFDGQNQVIDPGEGYFNNVYFSNKGIKKIINHGFDINGEILLSGTFHDASPDYYDTVIVKCDTLTHYVASQHITATPGSYWDADSATIYFDRSGTQYVPRMTVGNVVFDNRGYKFLEDTLVTGNLTVNNNVYFRSSSDANTPYNIYVSGDFENNGSVTFYNDTVFFESYNTDSKSIKINGAQFYCLYFNQSHTSSRVYQMQDNIRVNQEMIIGNGATLKTGSSSLLLGNNDINNGGVYPDGEVHTVQTGGVLYVEAGGGILFDQNDMYPTLNVNGTLKVIGSSGNNATVGRSAGGYRRGTKINVESGGNIQFRYYNAEYLSYDGIVVKNGATIDAVNNFSDGIWNGMYPYSSYTDINTPTTIQDTFIYLNLQCDMTGVDTIKNITFNHPGTPTQGHHFNVYRPLGATDTVQFGGYVSGALSGETFELDEDQNTNGGEGLIHWPPVSSLTWDGSESSDWYDANNWSPAIVPDKAKDVIIPLITDGGDNPIITGLLTPQCRILHLTNGILAIEAGIDSLLVNQDVVCESDAILAIAGNTVLSVQGDMDVSSDAIFYPGSSLVDFVKSNGSSVISPRNAEFNDLKFSGGATFYLVGTEFTVNGDFYMSSGTVQPNSNNYTYHIAGDYTKTGGTFVTSPNVGFFDFNGSVTQDISGGRFSRLSIDNSSATVYIDDSASVAYNSTNYSYNAFEVKPNATFSAKSSAVLYVNGNVNIEAGGTFNDGDQTHRFAGRYWTGEGTYSGNGTIIFQGISQNLYRSHFNNLTFVNSSSTTNSWKYIKDTVNVNNDLIVNCYGVLLYNNHIINETGTGTFAIQETQPTNPYVYVRGADNYPSGFDSYTACPTSYTLYDAAFDQTVRGNSSGVDVQYGRLYLRNESTKTLEGDIDVEDRIALDYGKVVFDANDKIINIAGNWYNQNEGTFDPGIGEVIFDGADNQYMYLATSGTNDFYKIRVNKSNSATDVRIYYNDVTVDNKLWVRSGRFYCYNDYTVTVNGDFIASDNGLFLNAGTYKLAKSSGNVNVQFNGSEIRDLTIDGAATFTALDQIKVSNLFTLQNGTFDGNGQTVYLGDGYDVANIYGTYKIGSGGSLKIGTRTSFNVYNGGTVEVVGAEGAPATVTGRVTGAYYYFNIEDGATIKAQHYVFEYMDEAGIYVKSGGIIDATNNFSDGTFTNPASGGICLRIENTQSFIDNDSIVNVRFPYNPGNGTTNVAKLVSTAGVLDFYAASGELAGEDYEDDNYNLINWPGVNTVTWVGGNYISQADDRQDWNNANNWDVERVPGINDYVVIPDDVTYNCVVNIGEVANYSDTIKNLENNYYLKFRVNAGSSTQLVVADEVENTGDVEFVSDSSILTVNGAINNSGSFTEATSGGTLRFNGTDLITVGSTMDYNWLRLVVDKTGAVQFSRDATFRKIEIDNGTLQYTSNTRTLTCKEDFLNSGTVDMAQSKLVLGSVGSYSFKPNTSSIYYVEFTAGDYTLNSPIFDNTYIIDIKNGASINMNGNTITYGSGSVSGSLMVAGQLTINDDATLKMRDKSDMAVTGTLKAVGTENHEAKITREGSGYYNLVVNGGNIGAGRYIFEYLDTAGLVVESGSTIDSLSNGKFSYGKSGGRYLYLKQNIGASDSDTLKISDIQFDGGPAYNAKRDSTLVYGIVDFKDCFGLRAGQYYEDDDSSMQHGVITWSYTQPTLFWEGDVSTKWDQQQNWSPEGVPDSASIIFIPAGTTYYPVIDNTITSDTAFARKITVYSGGSMTFGDDKDMYVKEDFTNGGVFTINSGSDTYLTVGKGWANDGTFTHGGNSTVEFTSSANLDINTGGDAFYNLILNSGDGAGSAEFNTQSDLDVDGSLTVSKGTLKVSNSAHKIYVGGNFTVNDGFDNGSGEVILDGSSAQSINNALNAFYKLTLTGNGSKTLLSNITVNKDLTNNSTFNAGSYNINLLADLLGTGTFSAQTSTVTLSGTGSQFINTPVTFNNLVVNNTATLTAVNLEDPVSVTGVLTMSDGIIETSTSNLLTLESTATLSGSSSISYVNGALKKVGDADFVFPIGSSNIYAPLGISSLAVSSSFTASYYESSYNSSSLQSGLNHVSEIEHWKLDRNSGTAEPYVKFYWYDGTHSDISDTAAIVAAYYESGLGWKSYGHGAVTGDVNAGTVKSLTRFDKFGYCGFGWTYISLTWTGANGTAWAQANNWDNGSQVPSQTTNIIVPNGATNYPTISTDESIYDLTIKNGGSLNISTTKSLNVNGIFTINSGGSLSLEGTSQLSLKQDATNSGTMTAGTGCTVIVDGTKAQSISNIRSYDMVISGSDTKTFADSIWLDHNLTISGTLNAGSSVLTIGGGITLNGTYTGSTGETILGGVAQQTFGGTQQIEFDDLTVNNTFATVPQILLSNNVLVNGVFKLTDGIVSSSSTHILSIGTSGSISGGNDTSFVTGPMRKNGITDFVFPVGRDSVYARIGISGMTGSGVFDAQYFNTSYGDVSSITAPIDHVSLVEFWDLSRPSGTAEPKVTLYWQDTAHSHVTKPDSLLVAHFTSGAWQNLGNASASWSGVGSCPGSVTSTSAMTLFSPLTLAAITSQANPLPVELAYFNVTVENDFVKTKWSTYSETNSDYYVVERSRDGILFVPFDTINSVGNSSSQEYYSTLDRIPYKGLSYYRLTQVDYDGTETTYPLKSVEIKDAMRQLNVKVYPNPTNKQKLFVEITGQVGSDIRLLLFSTSGQIIINKRINSQQKTLDLSQDISNVKPGVYSITFITDNETINKKLVIQ